MDPDLAPERRGKRLGPGAVAIGEDQHARADFGCRPREPVRERDRHDPVPASERGHRSTRPRTGSRVVGKDAEHPAVVQRHRRPDPSGERGFDDVPQIQGALGHVDVRVFLVDDNRRGGVDLRVGEVAVEVELDPDHHAGPDQRAQACQQIALGVRIAVGDHRAVQVQQHRVDRQRSHQVPGRRAASNAARCRRPASRRRRGPRHRPASVSARSFTISGSAKSRLVAVLAARTSIALEQPEPGGNR
jgi:hypothetical protein